MNEYVEGEKVRCAGQFKNSAGTLQDPDVIKFVYKPPRSAAVEKVYGTDEEVVKDSTGNYHVDLDTSGKPGTWGYRFFSTGNGQTAGQNQFHVLKASPGSP